MMDKWENHGGPAFPVTVKTGEHGELSFKGMSLRDWFAGQALAGMLACPADYVGAKDFDGRVARAYEYADAMVARSKRGDQ